MTNNYCVILAGGIGSRFWPFSRATYPKQFLDFFGTGRSLLQITYDRFTKIIPKENIYIATNESYSDLVHQQLPQLKGSQILLEPKRRNTAPSVAYAAYHIRAINPDANIIVAPSDHLILKEDVFLEEVRKGLDFVKDNDALLTMGIRPSRPETGYGYIEGDLSMACPSNKEIYRVDAFKEKPDLETAKRYLQRKNYFWNAGIFIWNVSTIVNALRVYQPPMSKIFEGLLPYYYTDKEQEMIDKLFPTCENISIDYAIMEKADEIYVFPASFGWSDLGTWGSLHDNMKKDAHNNVCIGENIHLHESRNCIVHTTQEKKVIVQGLDGYIIAEKNNRLLICRLSEEQRIKEFAGE